VKLPGGKPTVTIQAERNTTSVPDTLSYSSAPTQGTIFYAAPNTRRIDSVYGEMKLPVFGAANNIPFFHELELQIAGRYERVSGSGGLRTINCLVTTRPLTPADVANTICPNPPTVPAPLIGSGTRESFNPTFAARWSPIRDLTFRASYAGGYLPPYFSDLIPVDQVLVFSGVTDSQRGGEPIGTPVIPGLSQIIGNGSGNPNLKPERGKTYSAGVILTPRFMSGFRFSVDWTRISTQDDVFSPIGNFIFSNQASFDEFLSIFPDRVTRGPRAPGDPFTVGPITYVDLGFVNLSHTNIETLDFQGDYTSKLGQGTLDLALRATYAYDLTVKLTDTTPGVNYAGVIGSNFLTGFSPTGGIKWKGNFEARYSTDTWSFGGRARYYDGYYTNMTHTPDAAGITRVSSQTYFDLFGSYKLNKSTEVRFSVQNVFNKLPPMDLSQNNPFGYSLAGGDALGGTYFLTVSKSF